MGDKKIQDLIFTLPNEGCIPKEKVRELVEKYKSYLCHHPEGPNAEREAGINDVLGGEVIPDLQKLIEEE